MVKSCVMMTGFLAAALSAACDAAVQNSERPGSVQYQPPASPVQPAGQAGAATIPTPVAPATPPVSSAPIIPQPPAAATPTPTPAPAPAAAPSSSAAGAPALAPAPPPAIGGAGPRTGAPPASPAAPPASAAGASAPAPGSTPDVATGFDAGSGMLQPDGKVVVFRIADGTGGKDWNKKDKPIRVKRGMTLRLIDDDKSTRAGGHWLHTYGQPCPHGTREIGTGFDCVISQKAPVGLVSGVFEHNVANGIGQLYIEVVAD